MCVFFLSELFQIAKLTVKNHKANYCELEIVESKESYLLFAPKQSSSSRHHFFNCRTVTVQRGYLQKFVMSRSEMVVPASNCPTSHSRSKHILGSENETKQHGKRMHRAWTRVSPCCHTSSPSTHFNGYTDIQIDK